MTSSSSTKDYVATIPADLELGDENIKNNNMKTATILASLVASTAAFAPVQQQVTKGTALKAYETELGVQEPVRRLTQRRRGGVFCLVRSV